MADLNTEIFFTLITMIATGVMAFSAFKIAQLQADRIYENVKEKSTMQVDQLTIELESKNAVLEEYAQHNVVLQDRIEHFQIELEQREILIEEIEARVNMMEELSVESRDLYDRVMQITGMLTQLMNVVMSLQVEIRKEFEEI